MSGTKLADGLCCGTERAGGTQGEGQGKRLSIQVEEDRVDPANPDSGRLAGTCVRAR